MLAYVGHEMLVSSIASLQTCIQAPLDISRFVLIQDNDIGDEGVRHICEALRSSSSIATISLGVRITY